MVHRLTNASGIGYDARIITTSKVAMDLVMDANGKVLEFKKAPE